MKTSTLLSLIFIVSSFFSCSSLSAAKSSINSERANETLYAILNLYASDNNFLLRETHPFNDQHAVTYLADNEQNNSQKPYSYLWPYSGGLSASVALYENNKNPKHLEIIETKILPGLHLYLDNKRSPTSYASYIDIEPAPDRFYDDNVWIGIDFTDLYLLTKNKKYLDSAKEVWKFIESGTDSVLGGGIYWCEQKKHGKNTCSNAPGAVYAFKLFEATKDSSYFYKGKKLYEWTKQNLQDKTDYLYFDNINLDGHVNKTKFAYNSGQMLQAAAMLYKITKNKTYLIEAQNIAKSSYKYFFHEQKSGDGKSFNLLKNGDIWFTAVMLRGFIELYSIDKNKEYLNAFRSNLDYAWNNMRDENGLFNKDWTLSTKDDSKWLLTQFGMTEMLARLGNL